MSPRAPARLLLAHPSSDLYGSDRVLGSAVRSLRDAGHEVLVTLDGPGPLVPLLQELGARVRYLRMPVLRRSLLGPGSAAGFLARTLGRLPAAVRLLRDERVDLVYVSTLTLPGWLLAGRLAGLPVLAHVHEAEDRVRGPLRTGLHLPLLLADRVVANSIATRRSLGSALPRLRDRTHVVYNGVGGPRSVSPLRAELRGPVRLLLVGRLSPVKGTDIAVQALGRLRQAGVDARLTLVGDVFPGNEGFLEQVRRLVHDLGLDRHVTCAGFQPDMAPFFRDADIVLVPSRLESFGNVAVEAALAGRPVVASDVQGLRESVEDPLSGRLVPPEAPAAVAQAVQELLADWGRTRARAPQARSRALRAFGEQRFAAELNREVDAVLSDREVGDVSGRSPRRRRRSAASRPG